MAKTEEAKHHVIIASSSEEIAKKTANGIMDGDKYAAAAGMELRQRRQRQMFIYSCIAGQYYAHVDPRMTLPKVKANQALPQSSAAKKPEKRIFETGN